jgi:methionine--tRNA ligase beta chain
MASIQDFQRLDLRVGTIVAAEKVAGTDKLIKLTVDIGDAQRTMVAGIGLVYPAEGLVGRQVACVVNLDPVVLRGVKSEGMILAAGDERDLALIVPDKPRPAGAQIR